MMATCFLRSLIDITKDGEWGKGEPFDSSVEMAVIRGTDFANARVGVLDHLPVRYIVEHIAARKRLRPFDILIETAGGTKDQPTGRTLFVKPSLLSKSALPFTCASFARFIRIDRAKADPEYIFWLLQALYKGGQIRQYHTQHTGVARFQFTTFAERESLSLPTKIIQRRVASVLSAYDDLIENNTRRIKILDAMAQMLYREWFVNFRFPGHEKVRMVGSEFGSIPEGWIQPYQEFVDFLEGPGLRRWQYREKGVPFLNIRTITDNDIDLGKTQFVDPEEVASKYNHFLLSEFDHVVSSSGTLGRIATVRSQHLPVMLNTSIIRMRPKTSAVGRWQLKHFLKSDYFQSQIRAFAIGAAQMNFGPSHLKQAKILAPVEQVGRTYEALVSPSELLILNLIQKNSNLRKTRDFLLPKLISGEIPVEAVDEKAAELMEAIA